MLMYRPSPCSCGMSLNGPEQLEDHVRGKKHHKRVRGITATLPKIVAPENMVLLHEQDSLLRDVDLNRALSRVSFRSVYLAVSKL